ncbi:FAD-binding oxidoreductase [Saccharopolyspora sp. ASAGF58]|nr:FAD-binding oxidoreductase [Saccharopolyspora sp. ASAGF58]
MTASSNRVAVIGGGAVGVLCAGELQRAGADVVLLERSTCGTGASWGNAGWVVPSLSTPLGGPGLLRTTVRYIGWPGQGVRGGWKRGTRPSPPIG